MLIVSTFLWYSIGGTVSTLCAQAFGAKNYRLVGIWLQIGIATSTVLCAPVAALWVFAQDALRLLGFHSDSPLAGTFARWSLIGMWPNIMFVQFNNYYQVCCVVCAQRLESCRAIRLHAVCLRARVVLLLWAVNVTAAFVLFTLIRWLYCFLT
jgi:hypothetical protein